MRAHRTGYPASVFGIVEAVASLVVLPVLGRAKFRVADELGSRAPAPRFCWSGSPARGGSTQQERS